MSSALQVKQQLLFIVKLEKINVIYANYIIFEDHTSVGFLQVKYSTIL